jgi:imidazole glycerol-phosphate synthase subunit HisH
MNSQKKIVIVDCGVGNLWSVHKAFKQFAPNTVISEEPPDIEDADALVLPGVGTFSAGMEGLTKRGLVGPLKAAVERGVPLLGICLGAQLLLETGHEFGEQKGLGLIQGEVIPFPEFSHGEKLPVIGWQNIKPNEHPRAQDLFKDINTPCFYFVHSFLLNPSNKEDSVADTSYGDYSYCAVVGKGNIFGTQFHPEKSGEAGLQLIKNFISLI